MHIIEGWKALQSASPVLLHLPATSSVWSFHPIINLSPLCTSTALQRWATASPVLRHPEISQHLIMILNPFGVCPISLLLETNGWPKYCIATIPVILDGIGCNPYTIVQQNRIWLLAINWRLRETKPEHSCWCSRMPRATFVFFSNCSSPKRNRMLLDDH